ncbi:MAG TPA: DUF3090 family protein [Candidatus Deferrimicrobiaceae bacterium]|nr:DUF3090 family protein [Candidatus Deferrimicrobiaceae bacterium]
MSDNPSFEIDSPDHFTAGAVGPPGQRVFYLQSRDAGRLITLKVEKEHVRALAEYLGGLLARVKAAPGAPRGGAELLEPLEAAWDVGSLAVGYEESRDRVVVEASELIESEEEEQDGGPEPEPAMARFRITRAQAAAFVERANELMKGGRPTCPVCSRPIDPEGHVCPRSNGHVKH